MLGLGRPRRESGFQAERLGRPNKKAGPTGPRAAHSRDQAEPRPGRWCRPWGCRLRRRLLYRGPLRATAGCTGVGLFCALGLRGFLRGSVCRAGRDQDGPIGGRGRADESRRRRRPAELLPGQVRPGRRREAGCCSDAPCISAWLLSCLPSGLHAKSPQEAFPHPSPLCPLPAGWSLRP